MDLYFALQRPLKGRLATRVGIPGQPIHGPSMDHRIPIDDPSMVRRPFCHGPSMAHQWAIDGTILSSHQWAIAIFARV